MKKTSVSLMALLPGAAVAHPGHEEAFLQGSSHWLMQGDHLAVVVAGGLLLWAVLLPVALRVSRAQRRKADAQDDPQPREQ